jgi:uncharacterized Zn-finger protein
VRRFGGQRKHEGGFMIDVTQASPSAVIVKPQDLPVFCPNPAMPLWSSHPRVYLDIDAAGEARCPYCSTLYRLEGGTRGSGH